MTITSITVSRTIQLHQNEPLALSATAELAEGENASAEALELLELLRSILFVASGRMRRDLAPAREGRPLPLGLDDA